jgi:hypothetical protein
MIVSDLIDRIRERADDKVTPYLHSNIELVAYLNHSLEELCARSSYFRDKIDATIAAGARDYLLDYRIYHILKVYDTTNKVELRQCSSDVIDTWDTDETDVFLQYYALDSMHGYLSVYPKPSATFTPATLKLSVIRPPINPLSLNQSNTETVGTGTGAATNFTYTCNYPAVTTATITYIIGGVTISTTAAIGVFTDATNLTSGTINLATGVIALVFKAGKEPDDETDVTVTYTSVYYTDTPEIRRDHHEGLIDGVLTQCYMKQDTDTKAMNDAELHRRFWDKFVGKVTKEIADYRAVSLRIAFPTGAF